MKAQYQNFINLNKNQISGREEVLRNILSLNGLTDRRDVESLQAYVAKFCSETVSSGLGRKALDLNAGHGAAALALAEEGFDVAALNTYETSFLILAELSACNDFNIFFGEGHIAQMEQVQQKFDLVYDCKTLTSLWSRNDRANFLQSVRNTLEEGGRFVLKTNILSSSFDPQDSFESILLDADYVMWRQTPASDAPGVVEINGKHWTAQKRLAPVEILRQEFRAAGFAILSEEVEVSHENGPETLRVVLARQ